MIEILNQLLNWLTDNVIKLEGLKPIEYIIEHSLMS